MGDKLAEAAKLVFSAVRENVQEQTGDEVVSAFNSASPEPGPSIAPLDETLNDEVQQLEQQLLEARNQVIEMRKTVSGGPCLCCRS